MQTNRTPLLVIVGVLAVAGIMVGLFGSSLLKSIALVLSSLAMFYLAYEVTRP